ncbi:tetratricopeptide repeat protein [Clostridium sp. AF32-12BH]|uniref:tetratricopeptide repeat protein n=1 Tax=Clostridium sp. AF32-12BH TaxID=2292006 RepID=UPI000E544C80|nr:tetratricopeptide repeat protein [Clostridium sp. AF32-12BH]RHP47580.1 tetratricopeptide repeat protein [Clostridium sp. AF32-12BH]
MAFDLTKFYKELDTCYAEHDLEKTERFLKEQQKKAYESGAWIPQNNGCPSCVPEMEPNMDYVAVCNEMACFYRGLSRWEESLETFSLAQKELESLYRKHTAEYATILLNKAGTYRYMGKLKEALEHFLQADRIYAGLDYKDPGTLAGLYNNIGLVYLDRKQPREAADYFRQAMEKLDQCEDCETERGTTWNNLAVAYDQKGEREKAEEAIEEAIQILQQLDGGMNPHYPAALNTRGTFAYRKGNYEQALADFEEALQKTRMVYGENTEYASGCANCALVCRKLGREDEAKKWEEKQREIEEKLHGEN